jgi:hypothetical protein
MIAAIAKGERRRRSVSVRVSTTTARLRNGVLSAVLATLGLIVATPAQAASWFEKAIYLRGPGYDAILPPCDAALGKIQSGFSTKEGRFWNSDLQILGFDKIRETAFRPWAEATIPRRFCTARALVSDGKARTVHYSIVEDGGMIGASWGVQWCVVGLDRNWAYNPRCKMARP